MAENTHNSQASRTPETKGEGEPKKKLWEKWQPRLAGAVLVLGFFGYLIDIPQKIGVLIGDEDTDKKNPVLLEQTLSGIIWDEETNDPLPEVLVFLAEFDTSDVTNDNGKFEFKVRGVKEAPVNLIASKEGYETHDTDATLGNTSFNFTMKTK